MALRCCARTTNHNSNFKASSALVELGTGSNPKRCVYTDVITTAHELGHVLGLAHENDKCAVMNSSSTSTSGSGTNPDPDWPSKCTPHTDQWYCRVLSKDDLKGAKSIYGGTPAVRDAEVLPRVRRPALSLWRPISPRASPSEQAALVLPDT